MSKTIRDSGAARTAAVNFRNAFAPRCGQSDRDYARSLVWLFATFVSPYF